MLKEIYRKFLLKECRAFVLLVCKDAFHNCGTPFAFPARSRYALLGEGLGNGERRLAVNEHRVDSADDCSLFLHDHKRMVFVGTFLIAEEVPVGKA